MVRRDRYLLISLLAACGRDGPEHDVDASRDAAAAWEFETPGVDLASAEERYTCSYHRVPTDLGPIGLVSFFGYAGVHGVSIEVIPGPVEDGSTDAECQRPRRAAILLSLDRQLGELALPEDAPLMLDGSLAIVVRIHYLNPNDTPTHVSGIVSWHRASGPAQSSSGLLASVRTDFAVPPGLSSIETTCSVPPTTRLIGAYPVSHPLGYRLTVSDDGGTLTSTFDWAHPGRASWPAPFYSPRGLLRSRCDFRNTTSETVAGGDRLFADERCGVSALVSPGVGLADCAP